jgi:hypothetical protein
MIPNSAVSTCHRDPGGVLSFDELLDAFMLASQSGGCVFSEMDFDLATSAIWAATLVAQTDVLLTNPRFKGGATQVIRQPQKEPLLIADQWRSLIDIVDDLVRPSQR